jgi:hypothetical protein
MNRAQAFYHLKQGYDIYRPSTSIVRAAILWKNKTYDDFIDDLDGLSLRATDWKIYIKSLVKVYRWVIKLDNGDYLITPEYYRNNMVYQIYTNPICRIQDSEKEIEE